MSGIVDAVKQLEVARSQAMETRRAWASKVPEYQALIESLLEGASVHSDLKLMVTVEESFFGKQITVRLGGKMPVGIDLDGKRLVHQGAALMFCLRPSGVVVAMYLAPTIRDWPEERSENTIIDRGLMEQLFERTTMQGLLVRFIEKATSDDWSNMD